MSDDVQNILIDVNNADGDADTTATIIIQNKINFIPKVSVIIPVYNVEQYLRECLDSVVNQTLKEIEIICVDDGSTDKSLEILKEYAQKDNRITIITQQNLHAGVARNAGLSVAKGEYLHFCDSDDWVEKDIYTECLKKEADVILFDAFKTDAFLNNKLSWKKEYLNKEKIKEDINRFEFEKCSGSPWGKLFKRDFVDNYGLRFQNLKCCNDIYFVKMSLALAKTIEIVDIPLYNWRFNAKGNTSSSRGLYSECVVFFAKQLYASLVKYGLFDKYKDLLYKSCTDAFAYEYSQCVFEKRENQLKLYKDFLPEPYLTSLIEKITPEISVIIPVYNAEKTLSRALDSLLQQTFTNFEIIAVNDGSTDGCLELLNFYKRKDHRVQVLNKINEGPGVARNVGMSVARGKYITFLDADDFCEPNMLAEYSKTLESTGADIVVSNFHKYSIHEQKVTGQGGHYAKKLLYNVDELGEEFFTISQPMPWNKIFRKEMLIKNNVTFPNLKASEDICFCCNAFACAQKIAFVENPFVFWTYDNENSLHFTSGSKNFECSFLCFVELKERLEKIGKYEINEKAFMKSFSHTCRWVINTSKLDPETTIGAVKKYMQIFDVKRYPYWENFINKSIDGVCGKNNIIISLTSYPARIGTVNQTIESLLNQTMKADKVILWLAPEQFPNKEADLPQQLLDLRNKGLTIDWYHDIKSYKKLIPTLKKYPDAVIVTADDDVIYAQDCIEKLYKAHLKSPHSVISHRTTRLHYNDGRIKIFPRAYYAGDNNEYIQEFRKPNIYNMQTGCQAVLYPAGCFYKDILNEDLIKRLAPTNDDQWFWAMAALKGYFVEVPEKNNYDIKYVPGTQDGECLWKINDRGEKLYFRDLKRIIDYYPDIKFMLDKENDENNKLLYNIANRSAVTFDKFNVNKNQLINWFLSCTKKSLNLDCPRTYNEKLQWLKIYNATPIKTLLADKVLVRDWVADRIGKEYLMPIYGVFNSFDEIDFDKLPNQFVIKTNHGSGWNIIVTDKTTLDLAETKKKIDGWMNRNFAYAAGLELHYRDIQPKILIEQYIDPSESDHEIQIWCFNGKMKFVSVESIKDMKELVRGTFYLDGTPTEFAISPSHYKKLDKITDKKAFDKAIELAKKMLIEDVPYIRIDFIEYHGDVRFREMTFTSGSGLSVIEPSKYNKKLGSWIKLPKQGYDIDTGFYYKIPKQHPVLSACLLFPWYLYKMFILQNKYNKLIFNKIINDLRKYRVDIRYIGKTGDIDVNGNVNVSRPDWMNGDGVIVSCANQKQHFDIQTSQDGKLMLYFRGHDYRYEGKRFPVYITYKSIKIDGVEILEKPFNAWHDKSFKYELNVKNSQNISIDIETGDSGYTDLELADLACKTHPNVRLDKEKFMEFVNNSWGVLRVPVEQINKMPNINSDVFISLGDACRPAYWLKKAGLRKYTLPFDWMMNYNLDLVLDTLKRPNLNWFDDFSEKPTQSSSKRNVQDNVSKMISLHHFPQDYSVSEYLPVFKSIFARRQKRFVKILSNYKNVCFVMNRTDFVTDIYNVIKQICDMYPETHFSVINVRQDASNNNIIKYQLNERCVLYDIHFNDVNENGSDKNTNGMFWIGNTEFWTNLMQNLHLNSGVAEIKDEDDISEYANEIIGSINLLRIKQNKLEKQFNADVIYTKQRIDTVVSEQKNMINNFKTQVDRLNNQIIEQQKTFDAVLSETNDKITKMNNGVIDAVNRLEQQLESDNNIIENNVSELSRQLDSGLHSVTNDIVSSIDVLSDKIELDTGIITDNITHGIDVLNEKIELNNENQDNIASKLDVAKVELNQTIELLSDKIISDFGVRHEQLSNKIQNTSNMSIKNINDLNKNINNMVNTHNNSMRSFVSKNTDKIVSDFDKKYSQLLNNVRNSLTSNSNEIKDLNKNLNRVVNDSHSNLQALVAKNTDKIVSSLDAKHNELNQNIELVSDKVVSEFGVKHEQLSDSIKNFVDEKYNGLYESIKQNEKLYDNLSQDLSDKMNDTLNQNAKDLDTKYNELSENISKNMFEQKADKKRIEDMLINLYALKDNKITNSLEFRTFGDLAHCIRQNLYKIPDDIDLVVGIPRSGMIPAYIVALFMNKKCCSLDEFIVGINSSNGFRNITDKPVHNVLVLDDSIFSGKEMSRVREKLSAFTDYKFTYMAVYARTQSASLVDIYLEIVDGCRVWQWNYLNHSISQTACFDMDGVLCVDPTDEQNDDGEKYETFIQTARPLYIPNYKIRAIVTSRLEKYRELTENWLKKNGVQYEELIMLDLPSAAERQKLGCHAQFKADVYKRLTDTSIFIESDQKQAKEIATLTGKKVLCVETDEIY